MRALLIVLFLFSFIANGATIRSKGTGVHGNIGQWNLWEGDLSPSDNDSFIVANADTIIIPNGTTFTGKFSMDSARTTRYNCLQIDGKLVLQGRADLMTFNTLIMHDTIDAAGYDIVYRTTSSTASRYNFIFTGSLNDSAVFMSSAPGSRIKYATNISNVSMPVVDFRYCKFVHTGTCYFKSVNAGQMINVRNCFFDSCRYYRFEHYYTADSVCIENNYIKNKTDTTAMLVLTATSSTAPTGKRTWKSNVYDNKYTISSILDTRGTKVITSNLVGFDAKYNMFISCAPQLTSCKSNLDSIFFYNLEGLGIPTGYPIRYCLNYNGQNNPHQIAAGVGNYIINGWYVENNYDPNVDPNVNTVFDPADFATAPANTTDTVNIKFCIFNGSRNNGKSNGSIFDFLGAQRNCYAFLFNNTYVADFGGTYSLFRNENNGIGGTGYVMIYNTIIYSRGSYDTGWVCMLERPNEPNQYDYVDFNNVWRYSPPPYDNLNLLITGKTYGDSGFNKFTKRVNPNFNASGANLLIYAKARGCDSSSLGVYNCFRNTDSLSARIRSAFLYITNSYTPTNSALDNAGLGGADIGATYIDAAPGSDPAVITIQPAPYTAIIGDSLLFYLSATGTTLTYQWYQNGSILSGKTDDTLKLKTLTAMNGYTYKCAVKASTGDTAWSNNVALTLVPAFELDTLGVWNGIVQKFKEMRKSIDSIYVDGTKATISDQDLFLKRIIFVPPSVIMASKSTAAIHPVILYYLSGSFEFDLKLLMNSVTNRSNPQTSIGLMISR